MNGSAALISLALFGRDSLQNPSIPTRLSLLMQMCGLLSSLTNGFSQVQDLLLFGRHSCVNGFGDGWWCHDGIPWVPWRSAPRQRDRPTTSHWAAVTMKVLLLTCFITGVHDDGYGNGIAKVTMSASDPISCFTYMSKYFPVRCRRESVSRLHRATSPTMCGVARSTCEFMGTSADHCG